MSTAQSLLHSNAQWAQEVQSSDPDFCRNSAKGQSPHTLWIGCADSRVPESVITAVMPGAIFTHRNIANQFHPDDNNVLSVLEFAVNYLKVKNVVIVGHSECGGAAACLGAVQRENFDPEDFVTMPGTPADAPLNRWLKPLTRLAATLGVSTTPPKVALPVVIEESVKRQVENVCESEVIVGAWTKGQEVHVHGWVYELAEGRLRDLGISRGC
ncbi:hypothetical protein AGABI1DRAFT_111160 [Agaricus bisporus var. burnettii JB137-S8]|uniref:Carbonic anhydrase n=2 Tax=Agaricus bisporus var. burnettii TaxID=192524 RepID=K5Y3M5_AGABU|nr:uncharacterized protein AGABI1DRAFT_111160 [Agaricus bisporus var. burnettii JB137-S8]EKM82555.1 hypothetical protein AGABI1DRAFT_111160 [Agaricus bisporus var. burnettii JB137-S8]KAF7778607.1 hypothetical protein Agabi119p4_2952 [Agaricus bisporus var. burnettii]